MKHLFEYYSDFYLQYYAAAIPKKCGTPDRPKCLFNDIKTCTKNITKIVIDFYSIFEKDQLKFFRLNDGVFDIFVPENEETTLCKKVCRKQTTKLEKICSPTHDRIMYQTNSTLDVIYTMQERRLKAMNDWMLHISNHLEDTRANLYAEQSLKVCSYIYNCAEDFFINFCSQQINSSNLNLDSAAYFFVEEFSEYNPKICQNFQDEYLFCHNLDDIHINYLQKSLNIKHNEPLIENNKSVTQGYSAQTISIIITSAIATISLVSIAAWKLYKYFVKPKEQINTTHIGKPAGVSL
jgi:hypothetical protein